MRKIGISDIEDIALGAALLGAGGGGDPYIGKLLAIGAVKECGEVSLIDVDELSDDDVVVPVASVGAPTILTEKGVGSNEFTKLIDMVGSYYGKKITAIMPIEAGGVNSMLPIAAAARLGLPMVDVDGMGRAFPEIQMVTFTIGGVSASPMLFIDEKGNMGLMETINNKWVENICRAGCTACGGSVVSTEYVMTASQVREFGVRGIVTRSQELGREYDARRILLRLHRRLPPVQGQDCRRAARDPRRLQLRQGRARGHRRRQGRPCGSRFPE